MRVDLSYVVLIVAMLVGCQSTGQKGASESEGAASIEMITSVEGISEYRLANGLQVLLFPDPSKANTTINMTYFVGSRHEGYGEAGMAHLLEHMLFKGTPDRPNIWRALQDRGAQFNGTTWVDRTNYYETLPASDENLEFALALEADRMVNSLISEEELQKEFSVVRNEFEMGENNPGRVLLQRLHSAAYLWHNYGNSTIGNQSDIERVPVESLRSFYQKYYQPDNAMLVVSGQFSKERALELIEEHFGSLPRPARTLPSTYTQEPVQDGERSVILRRTGEVPMAGLLYHIAPASHSDFVPIQAFSHYLLNRPSGALYKGLVEGGWAANIYGSPFAWRDPGTFWVMAQVADQKSPEKVLELMIEGIENLDPMSISEEDVQRFKNQALSNFRLNMSNSQSVAIGLSEWAAMGDWRLMFINRDRVENLSLDDVRQVASRYFLASNRTQGLFLPSDHIKRSPEIDMPDIASLVAGYEGREELAAGEAFEASYENIASRTEKRPLTGGISAALLPKSTRGQVLEVEIAVRYGNENSLLSRRQAERLLPSLMLRGTESLSYQQFQDRLVELDTTIDASNQGPGLTIFRVKTVRNHLDEALALLRDVLRRPALAEEQFATLKTQALTSLQEGLTDPRQLAQNALSRASFPFEPDSIFYVPTIEESLQQLEKLEKAELRSLHRDFWGAQNMSFAAVGDFEGEDLAALVEKHFSDWQSDELVASVIAPFQENKIKQLDIDTPDKKGAMVVVGHNLPLNIADPQYPALRLASFILGGSSSSRIFDRLRQQEGLAYGAWGSISADREGTFGRFTAGAICAPQNADKALGYLLEEIERFYVDGIAQEELESGRGSLLEVIRNQLVSDSNVVALLGQSLREERDIEFFAELMRNIEKLDLDAVNEAVASSLKPEGLTRIKAADRQGLRATSH